MATGKEIKARIKSVKNTGKITKAMELISTVKMKKSQELAVHARPFAIEAAKILGQIDPATFGVSHTRGKDLILVIASNKGLCGGYNVNVFKEIVAATGGKEAEFELVTAGKRARDFIGRTGNVLKADFSENLKDTITIRDAKTISRFLQDAYKSGEYTRVRVIYSHFVSAISQRPTLKTLFPISHSDMSEFLASLGVTVSSGKTPEIEPSPKALAETTLPMIYDLMVYEALLEAKASEHAARMVAMKNAKDSANKKVKGLTLTFNKARQASITKEVSEIVSGVESMKDA